MAEEGAEAVDAGLPEVGEGVPVELLRPLLAFLSVLGFLPGTGFLASFCFASINAELDSVNTSAQQ